MTRRRFSAPRAALRLAGALVTLFLTGAALPAADGAFDTSWGGDGISPGYPDSNPRSAAVAPDGLFYFTGETSLPDISEFEYLRNESSGGSTWYACSMGVSLLDNFDIRKILFDEEGKMLFAGTATVFGTETVERAFIARLTGAPACTLDGTFSGAGWEYFDDAPYCDTEDCRLVDLELSNDATTRYIALLEAVQNILVSDYYLVGLTAAGNLDPNFGTGGFAPVTAANLGLLGGGTASLAVDAANRPYVFHSYYDPNANFDLDSALTRFFSDGDLDGSFGTAGSKFFAVNDSEDTIARSVAIGNDGRLGFAWQSIENSNSTVMALEPVSGATAGSAVASRDIRIVAFDDLGRLLTASDVLGGDGLEIGRRIVVFNSTLSPDPTFGVSGVRFVDIDYGSSNAADLPVDLQFPGGKPLVLIETAQTAGGNQAVLVRLESSLIFADGFEWGSTRFWN